MPTDNNIGCSSRHDRKIGWNDELIVVRRKKKKFHGPLAWRRKIRGISGVSEPNNSHYAHPIRVLPRMLPPPQGKFGWNAVIWCDINRLYDFCGKLHWFIKHYILLIDNLLRFWRHTWFFLQLERTILKFDFNFGFNHNTDIYSCCIDSYFFWFKSSIISFLPYFPVVVQKYHSLFIYFERNQPYRNQIVH